MAQPRKWWPPQFGLGRLFLVTVLVAIFFSVAATAGYIEASGTVAAVTLLLAAVGYRRQGWFLAVRFLIGVLALVLLWVVAVDFSWFVEDCNLGGSSRDIAQYRIFRIVVLERLIREYPTSAARIAEDLGAPCPHKYERWHKCRWWGLVYPARPCIMGIDSLTDDGWYDDEMAGIVRSKGRASPQLAEEFRRRVLLGHDTQYLRRFFRELEKAKGTPEGDAQDPVTRDE